MNIKIDGLGAGECRSARFLQVQDKSEDVDVGMFIFEQRSNWQKKQF